MDLREHEGEVCRDKGFSRPALPSRYADDFSHFLVVPLVFSFNRDDECAGECVCDGERAGYGEFDRVGGDTGLQIIIAIVIVNGLITWVQWKKRGSVSTILAESIPMLHSCMAGDVCTNDGDELLGDKLLHDLLDRVWRGGSVATRQDLRTARNQR